MYDFQGTLDQANESFQKKEYAKAAYYYWEINFAYEDEQFPVHYTHRIGGDAQAGFERTMELISVEEILSSQFYRTLRSYYEKSPYTKKYLIGFERDIAKYAISHPRKQQTQKRHRRWSFVAIAVIIAAFGVYIYHRTLPETIASSPDGICKFFDVDLKYKCVEKMYSQGDDAFGFGSNTFYLQCDSAFVDRHICHLKSLDNATFTDSTIIISQRRGNIGGLLIIYLKHPRCPKYYAVAYYNHLNVEK